MKKNLKKIHTVSSNHYYLFTLLLIIASGAILYFMGRVPICKCGYIKFWHGLTHSSENSQHLTDFYTFSHVIHGIIFYWIITKLNRKLPLGLRLFIATLIEAAWELLENSDMVINRYRTATISLDYYGDSVINSIMDILAMIGGFYMAYKMQIRVLLVLIVAMEVIVGYLIRDNLTLNIIMLIYPFEGIKNWQSGV